MVLWLKSICGDEHVSFSQYAVEGPQATTTALSRHSYLHNTQHTAATAPSLIALHVFGTTCL